MVTGRFGSGNISPRNRAIAPYGYEPSRRDGEAKMTAYACRKCPIVFQVGYWTYWDIPGGCAQYICRFCGTMHRIEHRDNQPDILFALQGPIYALVEEVLETHDGEKYTVRVLPMSDDSWRRVKELPTPKSLQSVRNCHKRVEAAIDCQEAKALVGQGSSEPSQKLRKRFWL